MVNIIEPVYNSVIFIWNTHKRHSIPCPLTHWGWMMHIYVGNLTIIGSDNGLSPGRCQAIIWTNVGILSIGPLGTNFNDILIEIETFWFKKMHLNMPFGKWRPFCLGLNVRYLVSFVTLYSDPFHAFVFAILSMGYWVKDRPYYKEVLYMVSCFGVIIQNENFHKSISVRYISIVPTMQRNSKCKTRN